MPQLQVSIIVPVYKTPADLLRRFLDSALGQTFSDIELIAVNDASPDHCPGILDETASKDTRMRVVHRSVNGRAGMARNNGLDLVRGRYVFFADADDVMRPDMCETLVDLAKRHDADIVRGSFVSSDLNGRRVARNILKDRVFDLQEPKDRVWAYHNLTFALWDKLFRRQTIASLRFAQYEANIGEDTLFNVAALCRSRKMASTSYAGYDYTIHPESATGRTVKGMPYLQTLAESGRQIRRIIETQDGSLAGKQFADLMDLKRFAVGCGWIAEHPDIRQKDIMWKRWRRYFDDEVLPGIRFRPVLAAWTRIVSRLLAPDMAYPLIWGACRASHPLLLTQWLDRTHK